MKEIAYELQIVKGLAEAQKIELEVLKKQLEEIKLKSAKLEGEINLLKAKEQDFSQDLGKATLAKGKNQARYKWQQKDLENLVTSTEKDVHPATTKISNSSMPNQSEQTQSQTSPLRKSYP